RERRQAVASEHFRKSSLPHSTDYAFPRAPPVLPTADVCLIPPPAARVPTQRDTTHRRTLRRPRQHMRDQSARAAPSVYPARSILRTTRVLVGRAVAPHSNRRAPPRSDPSACAGLPVTLHRPVG